MANVKTLPSGVTVLGANPQGQQQYRDSSGNTYTMNEYNKGAPNYSFDYSVAPAAGNMAQRYPSNYNAPASGTPPAQSSVQSAESQYQQQYGTPPDLNTIRGNVSDMYASEIASIQSYYNNLLSQQAVTNQQNEGDTRASEAAAGLEGGSPMGDAAIAESKSASESANEGIVAKENQAEGAVYDTIATKSLSEYDTQKAAANQAAQLNISQNQQNAADALSKIQQIAVATPLDQLDQATYDQLYNQSGLNNPDLFNLLYNSYSGIGNMSQSDALTIMKYYQNAIALGTIKASNLDPNYITTVARAAKVDPSTVLSAVQKASTFNPGNINMQDAAPILSAPTGDIANTPDPSTGRTPNDVWQSAIDYALSGKNIQSYLGGLSGTGAGGILKSKIGNTATSLIAAAGVDMPTLQAEFAANQSAISKQVDYMNTTQRAVNNAENGGQQILDAFQSEGINASDSTYQNQLLNQITLNFQDSGNLRAYQAGLLEVANEYSQVFSRGGQNTVQSHYNAQDILNGNITLADLQGVMTELQSQGSIVIQGSIEQVRSIAGGGGTDAVASFLSTVYGVGGSQNQGGVASGNSQGGSAGGSPQIIHDASGKSYDLTGYAKDPQKAQKVQNILNTMGQLKTQGQIDTYIQKNAPGSLVTSDMIVAASQKYGVSWESLLAQMMEESTLGTKGQASKTMGKYNFANVGNDGTHTNSYDTPQGGVDAAAQWLSQHEQGFNTGQNGSSGGTTLMNGPDGQQYNVPNDQVQSFIAAGGSKAQ